MGAMRTMASTGTRARACTSPRARAEVSRVDGARRVGVKTRARGARLAAAARARATRASTSTGTRGGTRVASSRRDWDECVEWRDRRPPSEETLWLLDASILALALPGLAELLLDPVMGAVDTAFIGKLPGTAGADALGGMAVSTTCFTFCFKLFNFLAVVTGPLVAAKISANGGRDSPEGRRAAKKTVGNAMALALALGFATMGVMEVFTDDLLAFCGASHSQALLDQGGEAMDAVSVKGILEYGEDYLRIRAASLPACLIVMVGVGSFRGLLDTRTPLYVAILTEIFHLGLDPFLIYGFGPLEGFDVAGAATATTVAEWIGALWFWKLMMDEEILDFKSVFTLPDREDEDLGTLVNGSASQLLRTVLLQTVLVRATSTAALLDAAGAHQVCLQAWWVTLFGLDSVAVSAQALVASRLGKRDIAGARIAADRSLNWALGAGVLVGAVVFASADKLPYLFTNDPEVAAEAVTPIRILALLQPLNAAVFVGDGVFQGSSDFDFLAKAMAVSAGIGIITLTIAGYIDGASLTTVWIGMATLMFGRAATLGWRYYNDENSPLALTPGECTVYWDDVPTNGISQVETETETDGAIVVVPADEVDAKSSSS